MKVVFTDHARDKLLKELKKLGVTERTVRGILRKPDEMLYDALSDRFVAVSWVHGVAVVFERNDGDVVVITVIYSGELKDVVNKRKLAGRWI